jgi:hypothetical protein
MQYLRSILSVLSAPLIYGVFCVPLLSLLYGQFPELINAQGGTSSVPLLLATEVFQLIMLTVCGYVVAWIAPRHLRHHVIIATVVMLVIGVSVQLSFWDAVPQWHHYVFFACIFLGMLLGALIRTRHLGGRGFGE